MKFLLTGGNGYIGSHLATMLRRQGHEVNALIYYGTDAGILPGIGARVYDGDIRDYESVTRAAQGCDAVFHLASYVSMWAKDQKIFHEINVEGTQTLLDVCRDHGIRRVLISSSCGIFGPSRNGEYIDEEHHNNHRLVDPYEISKNAQVEIGKRYLKDGIEVLFVYPTRVFGPGLKCDGNSLTQIFEGVMKGTWRYVFGDGKIMGNYVYVKDVVRGMLLVMRYGVSGEGYILGGYNFTYNFLFEMLQYLTGRQLRIIYIPAFLLKLTGWICECKARWTGKKPFITCHAARKFTAHWIVCTRKIQQLGYRPTPLIKALNETLCSIDVPVKSTHPHSHSG